MASSIHYALARTLHAQGKIVEARHQAASSLALSVDTQADLADEIRAWLAGLPPL